MLGRLFWSRGAVVFDLDGTLLDTLDGLHVALNDALSAHGLPPVSRHEVRDSMHGGFEASVRAALREDPVDPGRESAVLASYRARYRQSMIASTTAYPAVREVLESLSVRGCRLAVCTNRDEPMALELLEGLGLRSYFGAVVGLREGVEPKPHAGPLLSCLRESGIAPDEALLVGDSAVDVACAAAAGVPCLVFEGGYGADALEPGAGIARFSSFGALLEARPPAATSE
jgi:phosphoglycolate phosphatase